MTGRPPGRTASSASRTPVRIATPNAKWSYGPATGHVQAHHLHQVSQAQLEAKIPAHAQGDDLAVKVATLEQLLDAHQLTHAHPSGSSADIIAGQILPFAPEPVREGERSWPDRDGEDQMGRLSNIHSEPIDGIGDPNKVGCMKSPST